MSRLFADADLTDDARNILDEHLNIGEGKPVSYLPIRTIRTLLKLDVDQYKSLVEQVGGICAVFLPDQTCIKSGAIYAYHPAGLKRVLDENAQLLRKCNWPTSCEGFVKRISAEWLADDDPMLPVVRAAFGEAVA